MCKGPEAATCRPETSGLWLQLGQLCGWGMGREMRWRVRQGLNQAGPCSLDFKHNGNHWRVLSLEATGLLFSAAWESQWGQVWVQRDPAGGTLYSNTSPAPCSCPAALKAPLRCLGQENSAGFTEEETEACSTPLLPSSFLSDSSRGGCMPSLSRRALDLLP